MLIPDRRTIVVLSSLVGAMTLTSALLLILEPRQDFQSVGDMSLSSVSHAGLGEKGLTNFSPDTTVLPWQQIIIHQTGTLAGTPEQLANFGRSSGAHGGGYHFFIGNGRGTNDGELVITEAWTNQHSTRQNHRSPNATDAITICMVADARQRAPSERQTKRLIWLVHQLQFRYGISSEHVVLRDKSGRGVVVGGLFPEAWFRQQLLTSNSH